LKNFLKIERARIEINQAELAQRVNVSTQTINAIELGKHSPSIILAMKIAMVFNKKVDEIFSLEDKDWK
jgi:putative transcriptional regulator